LEAGKEKHLISSARIALGRFGSILIAFSLAATSAAASSAAATAKVQVPVPPAHAKLELGLWGGLTRARTLGTTSYQDSWSTLLGTAVTESAALDVRSKDIPVFGASLTYFFHSHTGIQLYGGYTSSSAPSLSRMNVSWAFTNGTADSRAFDRSDESGRLTSASLCLNFVERLVFGRWRLQISAGPAYFLHELNGSSTFGYAVVKDSPVPKRPDIPPLESVDVLAVPLQLAKTTWNSWGADIGAGLHFQASPFLGFAAEARYFYVPEKTLGWTPQAGSYDGLFTAEFPGEPFGAADLDTLAGIGQRFELTVKPSHFQVTLGFLLTFGR
jgi:hypothetical protein